MNLKDLQYLIATAETRTMRQAAEQCNVTQPTLSMQLARLEDELGCLLFERSRRGVTLTRPGQLAVEHAYRILAEVQSMKQQCQDDGQPLSGPFRLGLIPTIGPYLVPRILGQLRKTYPQMQLHLREETTTRLMDKLTHGQLDAVICAEPLERDSLHKESLFSEAFFALLPADHKLVKEKSLRIEQLANEHLLLLEEGHCLREQTARLCQLNTANTDIQASSVESLRQMVAAGVGVTVLPAMTVCGRWARFSGTVTRPITPITPATKRTVILALRHSHPSFGAICQLAREIRDWSRA